MPVDLTALASEFTTDPRGYGYQAHKDAGNDGELARLINLVRDGSNPPTNPTAAGGRTDGAIIVNKGYLTPDELASSIVYSEYSAGGTAANIGRQYVDMLMTLPRVSVEEGANPRNGLLAIFAAGTATRANLVAAAQRFAARAEELFGRGERVTIDHVSQALRPAAQAEAGQEQEQADEGQE